MRKRSLFVGSCAELIGCRSGACVLFLGSGLSIVAPCRPTVVREGTSYFSGEDEEEKRDEEREGRLRGYRFAFREPP